MPDYMIANVDFHCPRETWQDFCRQVVKLYAEVGKLETIYLRKLEFEFEASEDSIITEEKADINKDPLPPGYTDQLKY
jgi:hypothetical protein